MATNINRTDGLDGVDDRTTGFIVLTSTALPVELTSFNAHSTGKTIALNWATATEENNEGFEIQKSTDGAAWSVVGFVAGNGNATRSNRYAYIDEAPVTGTNYYRLKQMDYDGAFAYSGIESMEWSGEAADGLRIYPNPVRDELVVESAAGNVVVYDGLGKVVRKVSIGLSRTSVDVSDLLKGIYLLRLEQTNGSFTTKLFFKQ